MVLQSSKPEKVSPVAAGTADAVAGYHCEALQAGRRDGGQTISHARHLQTSEVASGLRIAGLIAAVAVVTGCAGPQSALDTAGREADDVRDLFFLLVSGGAVLWVLMFGTFCYVAWYRPQPASRKVAEALIIGGGILLPVTVLSGLLIWTLPLMSAQRETGDGLIIRVTGEQWWWRVEYIRDGEVLVESANEVRLPKDARTEFRLAADRVIHSFWVPALAGKMDMFPGRETRLAVEPNKTGIFRGQCTEFCGESHALMAFNAVVMEPEAFEGWLEEERAQARAPDNALGSRGRELFLSQGCGACHAVRGTAATASVGPDLTHVGGRTSLGAGILPVTRDAFARWVRDAKAVKPAAKMPAYDFLSDDDLAAIAHYLEGLK